MCDSVHADKLKKVVHRKFAETVVEVQGHKCLHRTGSVGPMLLQVWTNNATNR